MVHIKLFEELTGELKSEVEIVYRDKNMVCLLPRSQKSSFLYAGGTQWCTKTKPGFDIMHNKEALLFRFIFKNKRKIRLSMVPHEDQFKFDWATENGGHVLSGSGFDPFTIKSNHPVEKDVQDVIDLIPQECKEEVLAIIKGNRKVSGGVIRDKNYRSPKIQKSYMDYNTIKYRYRGILDTISKKGNLIEIKFQDKKYHINHDNGTESFTDIDKFKKRLSEIVIELAPEYKYVVKDLNR
jgi:hypothetical protein